MPYVAERSSHGVVQSSVACDPVTPSFSASFKQPATLRPHPLVTSAIRMKQASGQRT
jgi:hypothetical protein